MGMIREILKMVQKTNRSFIREQLERTIVPVQAKKFSWEEVNRILDNWGDRDPGMIVIKDVKGKLKLLIGDPGVNLFMWVYFTVNRTGDIHFFSTAEIAKELGRRAQDPANKTEEEYEQLEHVACSPKYVEEFLRLLISVENYDWQWGKVELATYLISKDDCKKELDLEEMERQIRAAKCGDRPKNYMGINPAVLKNFAQRMNGSYQRFEDSSGLDLKHIDQPVEILLWEDSVRIELSEFIRVLEQISIHESLEDISDDVVNSILSIFDVTVGKNLPIHWEANYNPPQWEEFNREEEEVDHATLPVVKLLDHLRDKLAKQPDLILDKSFQLLYKFAVEM